VVLSEGVNDRLSGGGRPAALNGDSVERSSVRGDLKRGEVELDKAMSIRENAAGLRCPFIAARQRETTG
jgi:hypothetical protein